MSSSKFRRERDLIGEKDIPINALWGIHTARAVENFSVSGRRVRPELVHAFGEVKLASARANARLGYLPAEKAKAIEQACFEMAEGRLDEWVVVDPFQGGAGTSTNLNVCEVLANRALVILGHEPGQYEIVDPIEHLNLHQSTNDTYPTALRVAVLRGLKKLEDSITGLQHVCQDKEREFENVLKIGRTEMMDAVPLTLGREFGAWAEAFSRDRWRVYKCSERVRVVNLGGTAVGTGIGAPREYIFSVVDLLRELTGLPVCRAENLVDATQNADVFVEVSGMLKAHAMTLMKVSCDLRLMGSGPDAGFYEITLPALQAGSSIMPGKVNPVEPELVAQIALQVTAADQAIGLACGLGQLELNAYMPLIAENILEVLRLLAAGDELLANRCIKDVRANEKRCQELMRASRTLVTVLLPKIGYHKAAAVAALMERERVDIFEAAARVAGLSREEIAQGHSPQALN